MEAVYEDSLSHRNMGTPRLQQVNGLLMGDGKSVKEVGLDF